MSSCRLFCVKISIDSLTDMYFAEWFKRLNAVLTSAGRVHCFGTSLPLLLTITQIVMLSSHHRQDKRRLSCLVYVCGVNRIGDKSRLFSVVLTTFPDWAKQSRNFLSPTVSTCLQFCSHHWDGQDKSRLSCLVLSAVWTRHQRLVALIVNTSCM